MPNSAQTSTLLLGSDHDELGKVTVAEVAPRLAVGISCGRFPKGYPHVDPNEDAIFGWTDGSTNALAVADGHRGFDAAHAAITAIADAIVRSPVQSPEMEARRLSLVASQAVAAAVLPLGSPRSASETALTIAVVRGDALATCTLGDTACFVVTRRRAARTGTTSPFLTPQTDPSTIEVHTATMTRASKIVVASDGVLDFVRDVSHSLRSVWKLRAAAAAERLLDDAFAGGAGDNIAVGVLDQT